MERFGGQCLNLHSVIQVKCTDLDTAQVAIIAPPLPSVTSKIVLLLVVFCGIIAHNV
jgi:hypothetical protein